MKIESTKDISTQGKFRFMVCGKSGSGKTKLISTIPDKVLVLNADKGMMTLRDSDIDFVSVNKWEEVEEFMKYITTEESKEKYKWLAFDSMTSIMELLFKYLEDVKKLKGHDFWRDYGAYVLKFMRFFRDQPTYHTLAIFEAFEKETDDGGAYISYGISGEQGKRVPGFFDTVFVVKADKEGKRVLQTTTLGPWIAKDRSQILDKQEPADLSVIMNKIRGK